MKALKVVGAIVATLAIAGVIVYFAWLSPPGAAAVCGNVARLTKQETGRELPATLLNECLRQASTAPEFGRAVWVKQLKCMRDARSGEQLEQCHKVRL